MLSINTEIALRTMALSFTNADEFCRAIMYTPEGMKMTMFQNGGEVALHFYDLLDAKYGQLEILSSNTQTFGQRLYEEFALFWKNTKDKDSLTRGKTPHLRNKNSARRV